MNEMDKTDKIDEIKLAMDLRRCLVNVVDYTKGEKLYKRHVLSKVKDYVDNNVMRMALEGWEDEYISLVEHIKLKRSIGDKLNV